MIPFPEELGCWNRDNFSNIGEQSIYGLGKSTVRDSRNSIKVTFLITDENNLDDLLSWWSTEANYGNNRITTNLPFFGGYMGEVSSTGDLVLTENNGIYSIPFEFVSVITKDEQDLSLPSKIINLDATENFSDKIIVTWTDDAPAPLITYDLYADGVLIEEAVISPYTHYTTGSRYYYVLSTTPRGSVESNHDLGATQIDGGSDLDIGLLGHFLLNNNIDDLSGTFNDGERVNSDTQGDLVFNEAAVSGYSIIPSLADDLKDKKSGITTLSFWARGVLFISIADRVAETSDVWWIRTGDSIGMELFQRSNYTYPIVYTQTSPNYNEDVMNHYVFEVALSTSSPLRVWVNGVLESEKYLAFSHSGNNFSQREFRIGRYENSYFNDNFYDCYVSNLRVYNGIKDQTFVDSLMNEGYSPDILTKPTTTGLIAHYPLTGTAEDTTGNYDGTEVGGLSYVDDAEFGSVSAFDGVNSYIVTTNSVVLSTYTSIALSMWAKTDNFTSDQRILYLNDGTDANFIHFSFDASSVAFRSTGNISNEVISATLSTNTWYHILCTITNGALEVFIDGISVGTSTAINGITHNMKLWIGADIASVFILSGSVSDARVYNTALTTQEITDIYNYEKHYRPIPIDGDLIAFYPLAKNGDDNYHNEHDGIITNITHDGLSGTFNGIDSVLETQIPQTTSTEYTFSIWAKALINTTNRGMIGNYLNNNGLVGFRFDNGSLVFGIGNGTSYELIYNIPNTINVFSHYVATVTDTEVNVFVNGVLFQTLLLTSPMVATGDFSIGKTGASADNFFNGQLSKCRIYNKSIVLNQVEILYNKEKVDFGL